MTVIGGSNPLTTAHWYKSELYSTERLRFRNLGLTQKTKAPDQKVKVTDSFNPLKCHILKIAHHGSINGNSYEYIERLSPNHAVISCGEDYNLPHNVTRNIVREVKDGKIKLNLTKQGTIVYTIKKSIHSHRGDDTPHSMMIDPAAFTKLY